MEAWMWVAVEMCNAVIEAVLAFIFVTAFSKGKTKRSHVVVALTLGGVAAVKFLVSYYLNDSVVFIAMTTIIALFVIAFICFDIKTYWFLLAPLLYFILASCAEFLAALIVTVPQSASFGMIMKFTPNRFQSLVVSDFLQLLFIKIFERFRVGKLEKLEIRLWLPLCCLPIFSIIIVMQIVLESVSDDNPQTALSVVSIIAFFFLNVIIFALVEALIRRGEKDKLLAALEKQNAVQREHITLLTENRAQIRHLMHDLKLYTQGFLSLYETGQYEELAENIRKLARMQSEMPTVVSTGNPAFDAIASAKKEEAEKHGIACKWNIRIPEKLDVLSLDTCVLIGNALENAIEACLRTDKNRFIDLELETNRTRLLCTMRNTLDRKPEKDGEFLRTTKPDAAQHGIGLRSMKRCCDLMGGVMKWEFDDAVFTVLVSLPLTPGKLPLPLPRKRRSASAPWAAPKG
ncbi:MAG: GHKL domain-containing protein [Oscillospiraceae bacterium]|jgi:hypothetical protein|nr:GHKL domain-containing protein [Oscillospiraceae bacterium]